MIASDASPDPEWLDPEHFPFTEEEVFQAALLWKGEQEARRFASELADRERKDVINRAARLAELEAASAKGQNVIFVQGSIGDPTPWLWPALSVVSESCSARVRQGMAQLWSRRVDSMTFHENIDAATRAGLLASLEKLTAHLGDDPKRPELLEDFRREFAAIPPPTDEIRKQASDVVERERREWLALAAESKRRLDDRRSSTGSPPATPPRP